MKLISWNVNGLRAALNKGFEDFFKQSEADIFCIQETKMQEGQAELNFAKDYNIYMNSAEKKRIFRNCYLYKTKANKCNIWNRDRRA